MNIKYTFSSIHELGKRENQEDSLFPDINKGDTSDTNGLFILCDGMGGHESGEVASSTVCETMAGFLADSSRPFSGDEFGEALKAAYDALDAKDTPDSIKKMGTTMTFVKVFGGGCFVAHIGDSRVYHIRPSADKEDRIRFVTKDHSLVNDLIALGELTPEEAKTSKQKNVITRAMQPNLERRCKADTIILSDIQKGDYIFMCSDGMLEVTSDEELANIISMDVPDKKKIEILKNVTSDNKDNHTAFLIHIEGVSDNSVVISQKQHSVQVPKKRKYAIVSAIITSLIIIATVLYLIISRGGCCTISDQEEINKEIQTTNINDTTSVQLPQE